MPQVISTNIAALNSQRQLNASQMTLQTSLQRLSSGMRINSAKDDAAGQQIAEGLTAQIKGYTQAIRNANDGVSMAQTAEGALVEVSNMVQRMRELAVQSSNGNYTNTERSAINAEVQELRQEISRISDAVTFNGIKVIGQSASSLNFWIGQGANSTINAVKVNFIDITGGSGIQDFLTNAGVGTTGSAQITISAADIALNKINEIRGDLGAKMNRFEAASRNMENVIENLSASRSRIMDADFAAETANMTRAQILQQAGSAMLSQANQLPQNVMSLLK